MELTVVCKMSCLSTPQHPPRPSLLPVPLLLKLLAAASTIQVVPCIAVGCDVPVDPLSAPAAQLRPKLLQLLILLLLREYG